MPEALTIAFAPLEPGNPGKTFPQSRLIVFNSEMWPHLDQDTRDFVIEHERAHAAGIADEMGADGEALRQLAKANPATLNNYIKAARVFLDPESHPGHAERLEAITRAALKYDIARNGNPQAVELLARMETHQNFLASVSAGMAIIGTGISVFNKIFGIGPKPPRDQWDALSEAQRQSYAKRIVDYAFSGAFDNPREVLWNGVGSTPGLSSVATDSTSLENFTRRYSYIGQLIGKAELAFSLRRKEYEQYQKLKTTLIWGGGALGVLLFILFIVWLVKS